MSLNFAWLEDVFSPVERKIEEISREALLRSSEIFEMASDLAGTNAIPNAKLLPALKEMREITNGLKMLSDDLVKVRHAVVEVKDGIDDRFETLMEDVKRKSVDSRIDDALDERDYLVEVIRERCAKRTQLALVQEEKGGEAMYVQVSRLFAAELEDILREAGVTPGST